MIKKKHCCKILSNKLIIFYLLKYKYRLILFLEKYVKFKKKMKNNVTVVFITYKKYKLIN